MLFTILIVCCFEKIRKSDEFFDKFWHFLFYLLRAYCIIYKANLNLITFFLWEWFSIWNKNQVNHIANLIRLFLWYLLLIFLKIVSFDRKQCSTCLTIFKSLIDLTFNMWDKTIIFLPFWRNFKFNNTLFLKYIMIMMWSSFL